MTSISGHPTRRQVIAGAIGCGCTGIAATFSSAYAEQRLATGCLLTNYGITRYQSSGQPIYSITDDMFTKNSYFTSTGHADIDQQLDRAVKIAANILQVRPAFGFIDPDKFSVRQLDGMNAFASPRNADIPGTRGIVGFGMTKFRTELYGYDESGTTVMAIVAHEFGHILQNYRGYLTAIKTLQCEINADFLSGYYLGIRKLQVGSVSFDKAANLFDRLGRGSSGNPNRTHGNSNERVSAAAAGFKAGYSGHMNLNDAVLAGLKYINYHPA